MNTLNGYSKSTLTDLYALTASGGHFPIHEGRNDGKNKLVRTDASGYLQTGYINTNVATENNLSCSRLFFEHNNDGYIRKLTPERFRALITDSVYLPRLRMRNPSNGTSEQGGIPFPISLKGAGYPVYTDPEFASGTNSVHVYNNLGNNTVTISRITDNQGSANSSGYILQISTTSGEATPGRGGFYQTISSRKNAVFAQIFRAKIPTGFSVVNAENNMGNGYSTHWLTDTAGTGKWEWYIRVTICGTGGTFSGGGHIYLSGSGAVTWYLSYCNVIDLTKGNYDGLLTRYSDYATSAGYTTRLYANSSNLITYPGDYSLAYSRFQADASNIFPVSSNANGVITAHLHSGNYFAQIGLSSNGRMYYRTMAGLTLDSGVAWNKVAWTTDIPTVTNYYWANVPISATSNTGTSPTFANATTTGLLAVSYGNTHKGIKVGNNYINAINGELIIQNNAAIRFGGDSWDYNVWAGLKYVHSSKTISLGLADGTHFTANSALSGGTMQFPGINKFLLNGVVHVNSGSPGQFNDGIRLYGAAKDGKWSNINFGCDPNAASGTHANQWMIGRNTVNNFIIGAGSNYANTQFEIDPSGNVNIKGNTTLNGNLTLNASDIDRYITFNYTGYTNSSYSWRIGYLGSGNDDANYLVLQSSKTDGSWTNALRLGLTTLNANFSGLITATLGVLIGGTTDIGWYLNSSRICAGSSTARGVNVGNLLVSNAWADSSKVPTNGIYSKGNVSAAGFVKTSSSDSYVLLGGGGHKLISDFATSGHNHDGRYLRWNGSAANVSTMSWGTLTSANGYTILSHAASSDGGDMGFVNKGGKIFMLLDGHYYQNEGKYRVLDTSDFTTFSNAGSLTTRITIGGVTKDLKVDADTVDNHHAGYLNNNVALLCPWPDYSTMKNAGFLPNEYGTSGYGHPDAIYLLAICKWAIATYSNLRDITLIGTISPNSSGTCILHLYSSSGRDSSTLLPRYCSGTYTKLSGNTFHFGTVNYSWYYKREALTSDIPTVTNYYWANVPISNTSSNTTSPTFNIAAATRFSGELGDSSMTIKAERNNEINFGGTNNSATIYFGCRATGSKPIPTNFTFGSSTGTANIKANGFIKAGSNNTYVLLGGGSHKALSDFAMSSNYVKKAGDTLSSGTSQIQRAGSSVSWYLGRDNAMIRINSYSGYNVIASMKTTNGDWSLGVYSNNILYFTYFTDTNVSGKVNTPATQIFMNPSGHLYATHFYESSDINLKTNIENINTADNMPILKSFDWKSDGTHSYGLIAQELEEQGYSELVETKEDGYKSVNYSAALSLIIGKLQVKIRELEKEIENLKNQN